MQGEHFNAMRIKKFDSVCEYVGEVILVLIFVIVIWMGVFSRLGELFSSSTYSIQVAEASVASEIEAGEASKPEEVTYNRDEKICQLWASQCAIAIAVMKAESQGNPSAIGDKHLVFNYKGEEIGYSVGLFQIRTGGNDNGVIWSRADKMGLTVAEFTEKMQNPDENIKYAYEIYKKSGFTPWSTYVNGDYLKYL